MTSGFNKRIHQDNHCLRRLLSRMMILSLSLILIGNYRNLIFTVKILKKNPRKKKSKKKTKLKLIPKIFLIPVKKNERKQNKFKRTKLYMTRFKMMKIRCGLRKKL